MEESNIGSEKVTESPDANHADTRQKNASLKYSIKCLRSITSVLADVAVILGLAFAAGQIIQFRGHEKVRIAVDATDIVYSAQFLSAYTNVIECERRGAEIPRDDLVFVANAYDSIAILYLRGVADGAIIRSRIGANIPGLLKILDKEKWPGTSTQNLQRLVQELRLTQQHNHEM